LKDKSSSKTFF